MSKILIETRLNSLKLNESKQPRKGCLGRIEGICADYGNPTRNGRFYSKELWENVFNHELVKESLESKTLIGELDHPEDRFEPLAKEACVTMTDYRFDDDKQVVYGGFDILDTPAGRILKSLVDYGCVMGVSSRGQGDIINTGDQESVDPKTYEFACFDVVTTPAVMSARQKVTEGLDIKNNKIKSLQESILEQVNSSTTNSELDTILKVVESTGLSNLAKIKAAIRNKRKSIVEGKTISDKAVEDLQQAKDSLEIENEKLKSEIDKTINESKTLSKSVSQLSSQLLAYRHRENRLIEKLENNNNQMSINNNRLSEQISNNKKLKSKNVSLIKENRSVVTENNKLSSKNKNLISDNERLSESYELLNKKSAFLESKLNRIQDELKSIKSYNEELISENKRFKDDNSNLSSKLSIQESKIIDLSNEINDKSNQLNESLNANKKVIKESSIREKTTMKLLEDFKNRYIESICSKYGVDSTELKKFITINENTSAESIESKITNYIEKLDRYSSLPFSNSAPHATRVLSENLKSDSSFADEELEISKRFMESVAGIK